MFKLLCFLLLTGSTLICQPSLTQQEFPTNYSIQGETFLAIEAAVSVFRSKLTNPDFTKYRISILHQDSTIIVAFQNKGPRSMEIRGNPGPLLEFTVTINPSNLKIIKSNFIR